MPEILYAEWPNSSNLACASYYAEQKDLLVKFKNGGRYLYSGVPRELWEGLAEAISAGSFLSFNIKGKYPSRKLEPEEHQFDEDETLKEQK